MFPLVNQFILWKLPEGSHYYVSKVLDIIDDHLRLQDVWCTRSILLDEDTWLCRNYKDDKGLCILSIYDDFNLLSFSDENPEIFI